MDSLECFKLDLLMHLEAFLNKVDIFSPCFVCWCLKARKLDRLKKIFAIFADLNFNFQLVLSDVREPVAGRWLPVLQWLVLIPPGSGLSSKTWCLSVVKINMDLGVGTLM